MVPAVLATVTIPDAITFVLAAAITLVGAFGVVLMRNPVHSALMLVMTLFGVAVLFVEENAQFLAAVQVIVYAGAIVVLFLFVIMLLGVDRKERILAEVFRGQRPLALGLGLMGLAEVLLLGTSHWTTGARSVAGAMSTATGASGASGTYGGTPSLNTADLGRSIFTTYLLPFEVTSALLVVAIVGAVVLARRPQRRPGAPDAESAAGQTIPSDQPLGSGGTGAMTPPAGAAEHDPASAQPAPGALSAAGRGGGSAR